MKSVAARLSQVLVLVAWQVSSTHANQLENITCGEGTVFEAATSQCTCNITDFQQEHEDPNQINIAGIFDTSFDWAQDIFGYTFDRVHEPPHDGYPRFTFTLADSGCDETKAARAYWDARVQNGGIPPHGVVGARCSGASIAIARFAVMEDVPQISPYATSTRLSNKDDFPFFSRMLAPDGRYGEVGAAVAMLREFGWERVTLLATDTQYSKDWVNDFRSLWVGPQRDLSGSWTGQVAFSDTIQLLSDGSVDSVSLLRTLDSVPTSDPTVNSRIIVLVAHSQHAYQILQSAATSGFQPDTVWVGTSAWTDRLPEDLGWLSDSTPGYFGIAPFRNQNDQYQEYLQGLQNWQAARGKPVVMDLPIAAAEVADSIEAMVRAIRATPPSQRRSGTMVTENLRRLQFEGVTGIVKFTTEGDRADPAFSILNLQQVGGEWEWQAVGETRAAVGHANIYGTTSLCFATQGCVSSSTADIPDDTYPEEEEEDDKLPGWIFVIIAIPVVLFLLLAIKYWRSKKAKRRIKAELESFKDSVVGLRTADKNYIPTPSGKERKPSLLRKSMGDTSGFIDEPPSTIKLASAGAAPRVQWCWKETDGQMHLHDPKDIVGDPNECWIKYDDHANEKLEASYQEQGRRGEYSPLSGYVVNFETMIQTKPRTGFQRSVQRIVETSKGGVVDLKDVDLSNTDRGEHLPPDLAGEPQMVLVKGDVVQISKQRDEDGWAFGTKLHQAGEDAARRLLAFVTRGYENADDANVFTDSGWFRLDVTRIPSADDLAELKNSVGDTGSLGAPKGWDPVQDPSVVQLHPLRQGDAEFDDVHKAFLSTLRGIKVHGISRVQNLAMWQSYVVKRQTICYRETGIRAGDATTVQDEKAQRQALQRFERCWLWHGTNCDVMDKIMQQGFNRSYCGKNATVYGKGVYFARDASYSASTTYAVPDSSGYQYILACRVVVGEYCRGRQNALAPDIRDAQTNSLYDSTVDSRSHPSIYVTYHDAQAYPEYLIKFKLGR